MGLKDVDIICMYHEIHEYKAQNHAEKRIAFPAFVCATFLLIHTTVFKTN